jgi:hypothetical protein
MDNLLSPKNPGIIAKNLKEEVGPQDDLIQVKVYFFGKEKDIRTRVFPQDKYFHTNHSLTTFLDSINILFQLY